MKYTFSDRIRATQSEMRSGSSQQSASMSSRGILPSLNDIFPNTHRQAIGFARSDCTLPFLLGQTELLPSQPPGTCRTHVHYFADLQENAQAENCDRSVDGNANDTRLTLNMFLPSTARMQRTERCDEGENAAFRFDCYAVPLFAECSVIPPLILSYFSLVLNIPTRGTHDSDAFRPFHLMLKSNRSAEHQITRSVRRASSHRSIALPKTS